MLTQCVTCVTLLVNSEGGNLHARQKPQSQRGA
jgi:ribosomal protein S27E